MNKGERKFIFFLLLLIIILSSIYIYKIKSKTKYNKELYNEIYSEYEKIFANRGNNLEDANLINENKEDKTVYLRKDSKGNEYRVAGKILIPKIGIEYPIIYETNDEYLKIAPTKLFGPEVNEIGNLCIVGHNYKNNQFFSRISELDIGDKVILASNKGKDMVYSVYDKYEIDEADMSCTSQETEGNIELTLITCTKNKKKRLIVKCRAIK